MSVSSEDDDQAAESGHNDDGDKPYVCTTCNYTFTRKHDRDRHVRRHEGSNPYTCPDCGEGFYRSDTLARHQRSDRGRLSCQLRRQMNGLQPGQAAVPSRNSLPSGSPRQQHIPPTQRSPGQPAPLTPASWEQHPEVPYMDVQRYPSAPEYRPAPPLSAASDAPRVPYPSSGYWAGGYYVAMDDPMWRSGYEYGLSRARDSFSQASPPAHSPPQQAASTQGYHQRQPSSHQIAQSPQAQHAPQLPAVQRNVSSGTFRTDVGSYPTPDSIGEWRPPSERPGQSCTIRRGSPSRTRSQAPPIPRSIIREGTILPRRRRRLRQTPRTEIGCPRSGT
ncbi:hypothetical protein DFJ74DRAFT_421146 [Hyaloraphidium curvatum]|nr:hypothetical protein DFJ74DRAFT_421146 [Hyaloraphidium curvatum]